MQGHTTHPNTTTRAGDERDSMTCDTRDITGRSGVGEHDLDDSPHRRHVGDGNDDGPREILDNKATPALAARACPVLRQTTSMPARTQQLATPARTGGVTRPADRQVLR